ncbi:MAG: hypothetical protein OEN01_09230 [Candidatus Krumholzibacteria bacterium]|nr:hypothetical protein [Candidatus Krumholzibacteria bacterium]
MRIRGLLLALLFVGAFFYVGCSGGGDPAGPGSAVSFDMVNVSGPCNDVTPMAWAASVEDDGRGNTECPDTTWTIPAHILGEADGSFVSMGGDSSDNITVHMEVDIFDGPGCDLVVYEAETGETDASYNVYVSDDAVSGFVLVATVAMEGVYCIDLAGTGVNSGRYVKIEQSADVDGFDSEAPCDSTWGADIDAIGVINDDVCGDFDMMCDEIGVQVDFVCPPDAAYRNHGAYVSCVAHAATEFLREFKDCYTEEDIEEVHGCIVSQRARTDIGK